MLRTLRRILSFFPYLLLRIHHIEKYNLGRNLGKSLIYKAKGNVPTLVDFQPN
jgi:hypothetical protein